MDRLFVDPMRLCGCVLVCLGFLLPVQAFAQEGEAPQQESSFLPKLYIGPMLGPHIRLKSWDLNASADQGQVDALAWPQIGARFGSTLFGYLSIDGELSYLTYASRTGDRNHALAYRAGALGELFPSRTLSPFATAGFGAYHNVVGSHGVDVDMRTDYGFGVRYVLSDSWKARADLRHVLSDGVGDFELGHNLEIVLSVELTAWRGIEDEDGDGVADAMDMCPASAGPAEQGGCPDSDGDGILDKDDRCKQSVGSAEGRGCPDTDGDKLLDPDDLCPTKPGPIKQGGCPSLDVDGDGVPDDQDTCPEVAEDVDGFEDEDGCPDLDNDQDTIADVDDACPLVPESLNGIDDRDGCPETDRDGDQVMDTQDRCPDEAETLNEFQDLDGCPDEVPEEVLSMDGPFIGVAFTDPAKPELTPESRTKLEPLVALMKKHPSVRYTITVYTGVEGDDQDNFFVSERQAKALRKHLLDQGIKSEHVQAVGGGEVDASESKALKKSGVVILERF